MSDQEERLYREREARTGNAINLRTPDRVPVWNGVPGPYPAERRGIPRREQMEDVKTENVEAMVDFTEEYGVY